MKQYISSYAFFAVCISTIVGVAAPFYWWWIFSLICCFLLLVYRFNWRLAVICFAFSGLANQLQLNQKKQRSSILSRVNHSNAWWIQIKRTIAQDSNTVRFEMQILGIILGDTCEFLKNATAQMSMVNDATALHVGDLALVDQPKLTTAKAPVSPWDFDFESFYESRQIIGKSRIRSDQIVWKQRQVNSIHRWMEQIKVTINASVKPLLSAGPYELYKGVIWGDKGKISDTMIQGFQVSGTMHILSVSGMHMALIYGILVFCLKGLTKNSPEKEWLRLFLIPLFWLYAFFTGMSPPVFRAALFISVNLVGKYIFKRPVRVADLICMLATFQLLWNPQSIHDIGFQLSYAAMVGIGFIIPIAEKWNPFSSKWAGYFFDSIVVTLACSFTTLPLILMHFHQFPLWFLLGNLVFVPLFSVFMYLLIALMFCSGIPFVSSILAYLVNMLNACIEWCILHFLQLPKPFLFAYSVDFVDAIFLIAMVVLGVYWISHKRSFVSWGMLILALLYVAGNRYFPASERLAKKASDFPAVAIRPNAFKVQLAIPQKKEEIAKWNRIAQALHKDTLKITVKRK